MRIKFKAMGLQTHKEKEIIDITSEVEKLVRESAVQEGLVNVYIEHTSAGLGVTEGLWDVKEDIFKYLDQLAPSTGDLRHKRYLEQDGRLGVNPQAHMKSLICGYHVSFPIHKGKIIKGSRQSICFLEFDGPLYRYYNVQILGE